MSAALIPYTDEPNPLTGITNGRFGIWLFLASEVMLFAALISSYLVLRVGAATWPAGPDVQDVWLGTVNTVVLLASSAALWSAVHALRRGELLRSRIRLAIQLALALVFLGIKGYEYWHKFQNGVSPATSTYFALYFTLTGLHALHVVGGVVVNGFLLGPGAGLWRSRPAQFTGRVECSALYWYFVDGVWLVLFPLLYLF